MKARTLGKIVRDFFMTIETECSLRFGVKRLMARGTVLFIFRMPLSETARHHHRFPIDRTRAGR